MIVQLESIAYIILPANDVRQYVVDICEKEWSGDDFQKYGNDLYNAHWRLQEVDVSMIRPNATLLQSDVFQKDLLPRVTRQKELYKSKTPIPPLILRGYDLFIFDGYARYHLLKELGVKKCLAYVSTTETK